MPRSLTGSLVLSFSLIAAALFFGAQPQLAVSQAATPITGWLWSDTIGWVSMNCSNTSSCGTSNYGVSVQNDGTLAGYAWSDTIGWIKFGGLSGFPAGSGTVAQDAYMDTTSLKGWARACAGTTSGDCSSMTSRTDGWDGWIALSGTGFGPVLASGEFSGYSWGDVNVGWLSWSGAQYAVETTYLPCTATQGYQCVSGNSVHTAADCSVATDICASHGTGWFCSTDNNLCTPPPPPSSGTNPDGSSGTLFAKPALVRQGEPVRVIWTIENADSCTVTGNGDSWSGSASPAGGYTSRPVMQQVEYTLHCTGSGGSLEQTATVNIVPAWQER